MAAARHHYHARSEPDCGLSFWRNFSFRAHAYGSRPLRSCCRTCKEGCRGESQFLGTEFRSGFSLLLASEGLPEGVRSLSARKQSSPCAFLAEDDGGASGGEGKLVFQFAGDMV